MAPKVKPRVGFLSVRHDAFLTVDQLRQRAQARRSGPYAPPLPAATSSSSAASSSSTALTASAPAGPTPRTPSVALPAREPLRPDHATVRNLRRGGKQTAMEMGAGPVGVASIIHDLRHDRDAASAKGSKASLLSTWHEFHAAARESVGAILTALPIPLTPVGIEHVAAYFKVGGYRSYPNYLSAIRLVHIEAGHPWTEQLDVVSRWTTRSVLRGIGPARQSLEACPPRIIALNLNMEPVHDEGPICPRQWAVLCSFHMLRGAEFSSALASALTLDSAERRETLL